jgi:hypothetical protein
MSRRKRAVYISLAIFHLGFVAAGAFELDFEQAGPIAIGYAALSGTDGAYGFFAPGVGTQLRATFEVTDAGGHKSTDVLTTGVSHEADLRVGDLVAMYWIADQSLQRSLAASWAGRMFAKHPGAESVTVRLEAYDLPSMDEYREGRRPGWYPHYEAKFVPRAKLHEGQEAKRVQP